MSGCQSRVQVCIWDRTLRRAGNVIRLARVIRVMASHSIDEGCVASGRSAFDVQIETVDNCVAKWTGRRLSIPKEIPYGICE